MSITNLPKREQRGSRARCVLLTEGEPDEVASRLTEIATPVALIDSRRHFWMPRGFPAPAEAKIGNAKGLLPPNHRKVVTEWWLAVHDRANTPNWDIAATASIRGTDGLVLVEAKAHSAELKRAGHGITNEQNLARIRGAIGEANAALRLLDPRWCLSCDSHYQLANRFAWSWKLASLGVPVLLVYLGFLNAVEMADQGEPFADAETWERTVRSHARGVVPEDVWDREVDVHGTPLRAIIRSVELPLALSPNVNILIP